MKSLENIGSLLPFDIGAELLPPDFPTQVTVPIFIDGERVSWKPLEDEPESVDVGTVIGHFYAYAEHLERWGWKYLVFLDRTSLSRAFCLADTVWEEHLEAITERKDDE